MADPGRRRRYSCGPATVEVDPDGRVAAVRHPGRAAPYLTDLGLGAVSVPGSGGPAPDRVAFDVDEVQVTRRVADLEVSLRHTFSAGWGVRLALVNTGPDPVQVQTVELAVRPGPDTTGWVLPAGVAAGYAVLPTDVPGPVLGGRVRLGALDRATPVGLAVDRLRLPPAGRYVLSWQWRWHPSAARYHRDTPPSVPEALVVEADRSVSLLAGPDQAVTVSGPVGVDVIGEHRELVAGAGARARVEVAGSRGTAGFELRWADPAPVALARAGAALARRPRTPAGVVPLRDPAEALLLQQGLAFEPDDPTAEEALELFVARLPDPAPGPLAATVLCREYDRRADPDLLDLAERALLASADHPQPGLGITLTHLSVAQMAAGRAVGAAAERLRSTLRVWPEPESADLVGRLARLELAAVLAGRSPTADPRSLTDEAAALGHLLGGGLPGLPAHPVAAAVLAHLVLVLRMLPDPVGAGLARSWGCSARILADRALPALLVRLDEESDGAAWGWLVLADALADR